MKLLTRLLILFARPLHIWNVFFSLLVLSNVYRFGPLSALFLIWLKPAGYIGVAAYQYYMDSDAYYYFRNAGYRVRSLYLRVFAIDFFVFSVCYLIVGQLTYGKAHA